MLPSFPTVPSFAIQLRRSLGSDTLKLKRTAALWLAVAAGVLPVLLVFCMIWFEGGRILKPGLNPWPEYVRGAWRVATTLLLPLFVVLLASLLTSIEDQAHGWKHLHALPVRRGVVWLSKLLVLLALNALAQVWFLALLLVSGLVLAALRPEFGFGNYLPPVAPLLTLLLRTWVSTLGIAGIQFGLSLWRRGFVLPVGVGIAGSVAALTLLSWRHIGWIPFAGPMLTLAGVWAEASEPLQVPLTLASHEWRSLGWLGAALLATAALQHWRREE